MWTFHDSGNNSIISRGTSQSRGDSNEDYFSLVHKKRRKKTKKLMRFSQNCMQCKACRRS